MPRTFSSCPRSMRPRSRRTWRCRPDWWRKTADPRCYDAFLIVLSVDSKGGVELVLTGRDAGSARAGWRFFHGQLSGNNLEFSPSQRAGTWQMSWSDANSGRIVTLGMRGSSTGGKAAGNVPFTRLDG